MYSVLHFVDSSNLSLCVKYMKYKYVIIKKYFYLLRSNPIISDANGRESRDRNKFLVVE